MWEDHGHQSPIYKGTSGGLALSFSACDDHQVSVDTTVRNQLSFPTEPYVNLYPSQIQ